MTAEVTAASHRTSLEPPEDQKKDVLSWMECVSRKVSTRKSVNLDKHHWVHWKCKPQLSISLLQPKVGYRPKLGRSAAWLMVAFRQISWSQAVFCRKLGCPQRRMTRQNEEPQLCISAEVEHGNLCGAAEETDSKPQPKADSEEILGAVSCIIEK